MQSVPTTEVPSGSSLLLEQFCDFTSFWPLGLRSHTNASATIAGFVTLPKRLTFLATLTLAQMK